MSESVAPEPPRYVVAFRTHVWDDAIASVALRMEAASRGARFVILADESNGVLDVGRYEKVSHTADLTELGLPVAQGSLTLWFNADYAVYALAKALPGYDYYVVAEYDVTVNLNLDPVLAAIAARGLDMVAHQVMLSTPDWNWHHSAVTSFAEPWKALIPVLVLSSRAVARLLRARQALSRRFAEGSLREWAYCETFIPSVICTDPELRWAELGQFADLPHYGFRPFQLLGEAPEQLPGTIAHPVLSADRMAPHVLHAANPDDYVNPDSDLSRNLARFPLAAMAPYLRDCWIAAAHPGAVAALRRNMRDAGLPRDPALYDLALGKPALQSSVSIYAKGRTEAEDAAMLVSRPLEPDYGNHTDMALPIWWMVDLCDEYVIDEVHIVNRAAPGPTDRFV